MKTVLGKRARRDSNSTVMSDVTVLSLNDSPLAKRQRTCLGEGGDANKENIPPIADLSVSPPRPIVTGVGAARGRRRTTVTSTTAATTPRRRQLARSVSTPTIELGNFQLVTPPTTPTKTTSLTVYAHARAILRPSSTSALTGRNAERAVITSFLQGKDENKEKTCLYISGTPGTGKTFLVNDVIIGLKLKSKYLNCNGMGVEDIKSVARQTRDEKKNSKDTISVMVLDELEHLHGEAIPDIMSVATKAFRIIGISNAHTLTTKPTASTVTFHFKPYAAAEMNEIVSSRLAALPLPSDLKALVVPAALKFACTKIAGQTGDLRSCFALIREAIELAEKEHLKKTLAHQGDDELPIVTIGMGHILGAIKAAASKASGAASVVRQLNLQARLVLLSLLLAIRRLNASLSLTSTPKKGKQAAKPKANETLSIDSLFNFYTTLLKGNDAGFQPVTRSEFTDVLALLETQGLAECGLSAASSKGKKGDKAQTVGMPSNNREEEMVKGLTIPEDGKEEGPKEREIRSIWNKETSRIKREADDQALRFQKRKEAFEEAAEA